MTFCFLVCVDNQSYIQSIIEDLLILINTLSFNMNSQILCIKRMYERNMKITFNNDFIIHL